MEHINPDVNCVGCSACYAVCPVDAIKMDANANGFYIPKINEDKWIFCGKCVRVCPLTNCGENANWENAKCSYAFEKDENERRLSCSGGVFYALAKLVLKKQGYVCGCVWDENYKAKHICANSLEGVQRMRGSKYVQSDMGDCFSEIKGLLKEGKTVLFSGTGCQTTALKNYVGSNHNGNLITCALICGGVPSPLVWKLYREAVEKKAGAKIVKLGMRSKVRGWLMPEFVAKFDNGKTINEVLLQENLYGTNFVDGLFINSECMSCRFKLDTVQADILLGDDWGIDRARLKRSKNLGSSAVISLTETGNKWMKALQEDLHVEQGNLDDIIKSHHVLTHDHTENAYRSEFFSNLKNVNIIELLDTNFNRWKAKVSMSRLVEMLYRFKLYTPVYTILWKLRHK